MKKSNVLNKHYWTKEAEEWRRLKPPERPSKEEIDIYEKNLQEILRYRGNERIKAVIFGATPELRDLLAKYKIFDVTLVDINPNMVRAMQELLKISKGREVVVIAGWLKTGLPSHKYDFIFCDHGTAHIRFKDWPKLFSEQIRILKPDGFVVHNIVTRPEKEAISIKQYVDIYQKTRRHFTYADKFYYNYRCFMGLPNLQTKYFY